MVSAEAFVTSATERPRRVGPCNATSFVMEVARSALRPPSQRAGVQWAMGPDPCALRIWTGVLTSLLSLGRIAAYCLAEAEHDPGKCVRLELSERGG